MWIIDFRGGNLTTFNGLNVRAFRPWLLGAVHNLIAMLSDQFFGTFPNKISQRFIHPDQFHISVMNRNKITYRIKCITPLERGINQFILNFLSFVNFILEVFINLFQCCCPMSNLFFKVHPVFLKS